MPNQINCPLCGHLKTEVLFNVRDQIRDTDIEYQLARCPSCRLVFLDPRPSHEELALAYQSEYRTWQSGDSPSRLNAAIAKTGYRRKLKFIGPVSGTGTLLDVGCGDGGFILQAKRLGWAVTGTEFNDDQAGAVADSTGCEVRSGDLEDCGFRDGQLEAVTLWHVLEHVEDPVGTLRETRRLLCQGGRLYVTVPDSACWGAKLFGRYWAGYDAPRHLCDFNKETLRMALVKAGFEDVKMHYFMGTWGLFKISLEFVIADRVRSPRARQALEALVDNPMTAVLVAPVMMALQRLGSGCVITAVAVKR